MTLTKQDLGSIKNLLKDELVPIKNDISGIKGDIIGIRGDISGLQGDVLGLKKDVSGLKKEVTKLAVLQEDQADKIQILFEVADDTRQRIVRLHDHEDRIHSIEVDQTLLKVYIDANTIQIRNLKKQLASKK